MPEIPFKVSARTAKLIGMENFSNSEGAIIELVKNTYDADSKICIVYFDLVYDEIRLNDKTSKILNKSKSSIYVIDSGEGMTDTVIRNQWMTIGTDGKLFSDLSNRGRLKTGAKGIGRFALNRLGQKTQVKTFSAESGKGYRWSVDWRDFDVAGASVSDIKAELVELPELKLRDELRSLTQSLEEMKLIANDNFNSSGTIIRITDLNDEWSQEQLLKLFNNLEILLPPREQPDFKIFLFNPLTPGELGEVKGAFYDDYDYKVEAKFLNDNERNLVIKITRNELDQTVLLRDYIGFFDYRIADKFPFRREDFQSKTITLPTTIDKIFSNQIDLNLVEQIGAFDFTFYYLKLSISDDKADGDVQRYPYKEFSSSSRRAWLKKFGGVKIFRDEFRIRPYGENGEDWLKLGERQAQNPGGAGQKIGGFRIRPNQIAGTINISRTENTSFQDKSGREGIQENAVFDLFKNLIVEIIKFFETDRNTIMFTLSELHKKLNTEALIKQKAKEASDRIIDNTPENVQIKTQPTLFEKIDKTEYLEPFTETEKDLAHGFKILEEEIDEKNEEIMILRSFASVGLIISSFAHEVKSLRSRLRPRTVHLLRELSIHLDESKLQHIDKDDNPFYMIRLIQDEDTKLKHWLDYSLNTLKRDKRERTNIDLKQYFESFRSTWSKAVEQRNAQIYLNGSDTEVIKIRAFETDFDSIFNNMLSNSLNALKGISRPKRIDIDWRLEGDEVCITFEDNGKGLDPKYHDNPEMVFNLLETSKIDKKGEIIGTGLGLYICKSVIHEYKGSNLIIEDTVERFKLKITFPNKN